MLLYTQNWVSDKEFGISNFGIVCVASGEKHRKLLLEFIKNVRVYEPEIPILVYSESSLSICEMNNVSVVTDEKLERNWFDKYRAIYNSPFDKTIYLDVDIIPIAPFSQHLVETLDYCQIALRSGMNFNLEEEKEFPSAISQLNTGVILLRKEIIKEVVELTMHFRNKVSLSAKHGDQIAFRMALLAAKPRFLELSSDFNFMTGFETIIDKVYLVHFAGKHEKIFDNKWRVRCASLGKLPSGSIVYQYLPIHVHKHFTSLLMIIKIVILDKLLNLKFRIYQLVLRSFTSRTSNVNK